MSEGHIILSIETATDVCSISLSCDDKIFANVNFIKKNSHSQIIHKYIEEVLNTANITYSVIKAIAISKGPGSYTGLRIGYATALGLSYVNNIPLIEVCTLSALAYSIIQCRDIKEEFLYCPMLDARRMEVYYGVFDNILNVIQGVAPFIISEDFCLDILQSHKILFFGNGVEKVKLLIKSPNAFFLSKIQTNANNVALLAYKKFLNQDFCDLDKISPNYLK